ncbi:hypothetical protein D4R78_05815 [bacterium]|nr:MAG: hypothetical protein D4R78_05815 [bacterium]
MIAKSVIHNHKPMSRFFKFFILTVFLSIFSVHYALAKPPVRDKQKLTALTKQLIETKDQQKLYAPFAELDDFYCAEHKYQDYTEFLKSLANKNKATEPFIDYYIASCRYQQLKYLEETQDWDEYFTNGNSYRDQITSGLKSVVAKTTPQDPLNIYARLLKWRFHKDQQDSFQETALDDLISATRDYVGKSADNNPVKKVADELFAYGEKAKAKEIYRLYVDKIISQSQGDDKLKDTARSFCKEGNLEFSEVVYDAYIEKVLKLWPKEKSIPALIDIAKLFAPQDKGPSDPLYAEKIFKKIEELGGKEAFDEELIYLRSFCLEKAKEYDQARENYIYLLERYPGTKYADEANFKIAVISAYILKDLKTAKDYFKLLAAKTTFSPQVIASLYQLGLLSQWEGDTLKAKEYYNNLLEKSQAGFAQTRALAQERLKEIAEEKPIEYNLKTFLDASLKDESVKPDMNKADLKTSLYRVKKGETIHIDSGGYSLEAGCMQVEQQYLWSGDIGKTQASFDQAGFDTSYTDSGTKIINLIMVSPSGIIGRDICLIDVN